MPRTILGKVSLTPKGEYSPDTAYTALDVVSYGGSSWLALQDVTGVAPVEGESWMLLAQKGDQGEQGIQGIQGIQGETGGPGPTGPQGASFTRLEKTAGTGAPGTIDTYTAYNSEGQEAGTVQVYQGMDGTGAGDFKADGTVPMTGDLQMAQHKITGLADATEDGDAVNKGQMDTGLAERADTTLSNLSNRQKALRNIGGRPNRNLLRNWYFAGGGTPGKFPINSKGKANYTASGNIINRWRLTNPNGTFTLTENGCTFAGTSGNIWIQEYLENPGQFYGEKVTISLLTDEQLITKTGELTTEEVSQNTGFSIGGSNGLSLGFYKASDGSAFFQIGVSSGNSNTLIAAKLELGDQQTLAYQDEDGAWQLFETPDYATEYVRCASFDDDGSYLGIVRGLGVRVNKNLLDNAYFVGGGSQQGGGKLPINQRGQTSWSQGSAFDRWSISKSSSSDAIVTLSEDGVSASAQCRFFERLDGKDLVGEQLTLSALLDSNELIFGTVTFNQQNSVAVNNGEFSLYMENRPDTTFTVFVISWIKGSGKKVVAAKLELGPTQTLAYQDEDGAWQLFETPDYAEELAKCQRYQMVYSGQGTLIPLSGYNANSLWGCIFLPEEMRITPSIGGGIIGIYGAGENISMPVSGFSISLFLFGNILVIRADKAAHGLTPYTATMQLNNLIFDANL